MAQSSLCFRNSWKKSISAQEAEHKKTGQGRKCSWAPGELDNFQRIKELSNSKLVGKDKTNIIFQHFS